MIFFTVWLCELHLIHQECRSYCKENFPQFQKTRTWIGDRGSRSSRRLLQASYIYMKNGILACC
ncbi:unnamed protein product, partial [Vitis vinifera]